MKHTLSRAVLALSSCVVLAGCSSDAPPSADSFTRVYSTIIQPKCTNNFCHFNGVSIRYSALDMSSQVRAYWSLVGQPGMGPACSQNGMRVAPGRPDLSILFQKILPSPPCGTQMPADTAGYSTNGTSELKFSGHALTLEEQTLIYNWIAQGAAEN